MPVLLNRPQPWRGASPLTGFPTRAFVTLALAVVVSALVLPAVAHAQSLPLSVAEALSRAQDQNYTVRLAEADRQIARAGVHQSRAVFLPRLSVSETATATTDPLNAFGFKLRQEVVTQADFAPEVLNDPGRVENFGMQVQVQQPVLNPAGLFERRAAQSRLAASTYALERTGHVIAFQVQQAYFGLALAHRRVATLDDALAAARVTLDQTQRFFDEGLITRADLLAARVRLLELESQHTEARNAVQETADRLRYLIGLDDEVALVLTDSLEAPEQGVDAVETERVNETRSDMQALRRQIDAARQTVRARRMAFVPSLNLFGSYDWNDSALLGTGGQGWTVGATLQWSPFQGFEQAGALQQARAELKRATLVYEDQMRQNYIELEAARRSLTVARERLGLTRTAVEQAEENLRIRADRYAQGLEQTTDVLAAEVALANARLSYLQTLYGYALSAFRLELLAEQPLVRR